MRNTFLGVSVICTTVTGSKKKTKPPQTGKKKKSGKHFADGSHPAAVLPMGGSLCLFAFNYRMGMDQIPLDLSTTILLQPDTP